MPIFSSPSRSYACWRQVKRSCKASTGLESGCQIVEMAATRAATARMEMTTGELSYAALNRDHGPAAPSAEGWSSPRWLEDVLPSPSSSNCPVAGPRTAGDCIAKHAVLTIRWPQLISPLGQPSTVPNDGLSTVLAVLEQVARTG